VSIIQNITLDTEKKQKMMEYVCERDFREIITNTRFDVREARLGQVPQESE